MQFLGTPTYGDLMLLDPQNVVLVYLGPNDDYDHTCWATIDGNTYTPHFTDGTLCRQLGYSDCTSSYIPASSVASAQG